MSRKWDAREAGREVAQSTIEKLENPPKFFLLFSTIHYEKNGGFEEFLNGVWDVLPDGTPLVGGTVAGFMNNFGCFTRGATALAASCPDLDVSTGIGNNTKKSPEKAVESVFKNLYEKPKYGNNAIIEVLPTAVIPRIPGVGQKNVVLSKKMGNTIVKLLPTMTRLNYGFDRADEILEHLSHYFSDRIIIGGCTMDDNKFLKTYQFNGRNVESNTLLALSISSPYKMHTISITGCKAHDVTFKIEDITNDKHVIKKIEGLGARTAVSKKLKLKIEEKDAVYQLYKNVYYYPLGFKKDNIWHPSLIGLIYGENLVFGNKIENDTLTLLSMSIADSIKKVREGIFKLSQKNPYCVFGFACETYIETLGKDIFEVQNSFMDLNSPFLVPFVAGESIYTQEMGYHHLYESINLLAFSDF